MEFNNVDFRYVPENADSIAESYTYADLLGAVLEWQVDNKDYFVVNKITPEKLTQCMVSELSGEFPETYLNDLIND